MALVLVITIVAFFINRYWSPILASKVRSTVLISTDSLYQADFNDAEFHIVQGKLVIHNLTLRPNMAVYRQRLAQGIAPNNLYTLKVKRIAIRRMHPLKLYFEHQLNIGQIVLSAPELQVNYQLNHKKDTTAKSRLTAWQRIRSSLSSIHIKQVMLNDVKLMYKDHSGNHVEISALKEMNLTGNELLIDSTTQFDNSRFYYFKDIQIELNNFSRPTSNGLYQFKVGLMKYSTLSQQLQAYNVGLQPLADSLFINRKIRTWYNFNVDSLQLDGFNFKNYNKYRLIHGSKLTFRHSDLVVNTERPKPGSVEVKGDRINTFPQLAIKRLPANLTLDTVELHDLNVTYKAKGRRSHKPGFISFNSTNGYLLNLTNNEDALKRDHVTRIKLNSRLMDSGPLQADLNFDLTSPSLNYDYKGFLGPMDMEDLNKAVMPFALVKITSGWLDKLSFDINGNSRTSAGKMTMLYHDLKVHLLKMDTVTDVYKHRAIPSLLANALIVKHNNPDNLISLPRSVDVSYTRQPDTPFFKAVWKTMLQGIRNSAGYDEATEKEVKRHIAQHAADKQKRQKKRALRKQRRALERAVKR